MALSGFSRAWMRLDLSGWTCTGFRGSGRFSLGMDGFYVSCFIWCGGVSVGADGVQCVWIRIPRTVDQFTVCISVGLNGFQWVWTVFSGFEWDSECLDAFRFVWMDLHRFQRIWTVSLGMDGFHVLQLGPSPKPNLWTKAEH